MISDFFFYGPMDKLLGFSAAILLGVSSYIGNTHPSYTILLAVGLGLGLGAALLAAIGAFISRREPRPTAIIPKASVVKLGTDILACIMAACAFIPFALNLGNESDSAKLATFLLGSFKVVYTFVLTFGESIRVIRVSKIIRQQGYENLYDD